MPLRSKFALSAIQGAVLSRTAALAAAAITLDMFVCSAPSEHNTAGVKERQQRSAGEDAVQWVQHGVQELMRAKHQFLTTQQTVQIDMPLQLWGQPKVVRTGGPGDDQSPWQQHQHH